MRIRKMLRKIYCIFSSATYILVIVLSIIDSFLYLTFKLEFFKLRNKTLFSLLLLGKGLPRNLAHELKQAYTQELNRISIMDLVKKGMNLGFSHIKIGRKGRSFF